MLLGIDPGKNCGGGLFDEGKLVMARLVSVDGPAEDPATWAELASLVMLIFKPGAGDHLAMEFPKIYTRKKSKANPENILQLAGMAGAIVQAAVYRGMKVTLYRPDQWKGQLDKDQVELRVKDRLDATELANIWVAGAKTHNIWEGIGIGLKHLKRFEPWRAYRT